MNPMEKSQFLIITEVVDTCVEQLEKCLQSIKEQSFTNWQFLIIRTGHTDVNIDNHLNKTSRKDERFHVSNCSDSIETRQITYSKFLENSAEFVVILSSDYHLSPRTLKTINEHLTQNKEVDFIYTDEDTVDLQGSYRDRIWKPAFSPEYLRNHNYIGGFYVIRRDIIMSILSLSSDSDEFVNHHDLLLSATEKARNVIHIPKVLCHRSISAANKCESDPQSATSSNSTEAVINHCSRSGINADVVRSELGILNINRRLTNYPLVSIVIPTAGHQKMIWGQKRCLVANAIGSILEKTTYPDYEIILVHDKVDVIDPETNQTLDDAHVNLVWYSKPFDFSDKCNLGVMHSKGEIIILLNDDTYVITPNWIESLIGYFQDPEVGMTGPMLLLEDGRIQSAGHCNNPAPNNWGSGELPSDISQQFRYQTAREVSGITGACAAVPRDLYFELGGLSLTFPHSFNDVDFAFKILNAGKKIIWTPHAQLYHFESLSRDPTVAPHEIQQLRNRWGRYFGSDPFIAK